MYINTPWYEYRLCVDNSQLTLARVIDKNISFRGLLFAVNAIGTTNNYYPIFIKLPIVCILI